MTQEMNQYIGTKRVLARSMNRQTYNDYRGWTLPANENGADEGMLVEYLDGGQANDPRHKGYISWSPLDVFNRAYRQTTGMTFGEAIEALKAGLRVTRAAWNERTIKVEFKPQSRSPVVYNGLGHILMASGEVAIFDPEDFDVVSQQENWCLMGNGYPSFTQYKEGGGGQERATVKLHHLIMPGVEFVDHINGNRLDNRRRNLRECTSAENNANRSSNPNSLSKYKGVTWDKSRSKWMASIQTGGKGRTLGRFHSEIDAAKAYDAAAKEAYGSFAKLNFIEPEVWLALSCNDSKRVPYQSFWSEHNAQHAKDQGGYATVLPSITMKTATGEILMGWLASQTDMLAEDWAIFGQASQAQPEAALFHGRWSLGHVDGNWRDIDREGHGGVMKIVWRMEDDKGPNASLEAQAHAVVAALNAVSDKPTIIDYEAEVDKMLAQVDAMHTPASFTDASNALMRGLVVLGTYSASKEHAIILAEALATSIRQAIPEAFEIAHG